MTELDRYLQVAHTVTHPVNPPKLPSLTPTLFTAITELAQTYQFRQPNISWALLALAEDAAQRLADRQLQAEAAWWLAWGANAYYRPNLAHTALDKAEALFNDDNWQHACLWQRNALPWTRNHYQTAASELDTAFQHLRRWQPTWARQCQQTLAFAYIFTYQFSDSEDHLTDNLAHVTGTDKAMGLLIQSSLVRRQESYDRATQLAMQARDIFAAESATFGCSRAEEFLAASYLRQEHFQTARYYYVNALQGYREFTIPLLEASCHNGLAQIANRVSEFATGSVHLKTAHTHFEALGLRGAVADNLVDSGIQDSLQGNYREASNKYHAAGIIYEELGSMSGWINARTQEARCQIQLGNLQMALGLLESAENRSNEPKRQAQLAHYLAIVWFYLNQYDRAQAYLQSAAKLYRQADQPQSHCKTLIQTAILQLQRGQSARTSLKPAAFLVETYQLIQQRPIVTYLQGIELLQAGDAQHAKQRLLEAQPELVGSDKIRCLQAFAACHSDHGQAILWCERAFEQAKDYPTLRWEVCVTRAQLADNEAESLKWLRTGLNALLVVQRTFSQPELASSFWQQPTGKLDEAVELAVTAQETNLLHEFIEEGKAQTFLHQIINPNHEKSERSTITTQLAQQQEKISRLIEQLNRAPNESLIRALHSAENRYANLLQKRDRMRVLAASKTATFRWKQACETFNQRLSKWIALDYYLLPQAVICVVGTANGKREIVQLERHDFALTTIADETVEPSQHVMETLGQLIPTTVWEMLTPETYLLIAPNRLLHAVSWAGVTRNQIPLVTQAIPSVVPSLQALKALFDRPKRKQPQRGTLLAVEQFRNRYDPLPAVNVEAQWLRQFTNLHDLSNTQNWSDLLQRMEAGEPSDFWHIATHAFFDAMTGWNSGFALSDEDVLLDQMWDAAPLPTLMTFAACSSGQRLVLAGDEQIGMPLLCLAAGANSVVAHLRPLIDDYSADLTITFYQAYLSGMSPAAALAQAQRAAWKSKTNPRHWQHALCFGLP